MITFDSFLSVYHKIKEILSNGKKRKWFFSFFIMGLVVFSFVGAYLLISSSKSGLWRYGGYIFALLALNLVLAIFFSIVILKKIIQLWIARRKGLAGSGLHIRISLLFAFVAVAPAIIVVFCSMFFLNFGLENWFHKTVGAAVKESSIIAHTYIGEHQEQIKGDIYALNASLEARPAWAQSSKVLNGFLSTQVELRSLTEGLIVTQNFDILARSDLTFSMEFDKIPQEQWEKAKKGDVAIFISPDKNRVRALLKTRAIEGGYVYLGRYLAPKVIERIKEIDQAGRDYNLRKENRFNLQISFFVFYVIISIILILSAMWVGLMFAGYLSRPIRKLIIAAEKIRLGDTKTLVEVDENHRELGTLARAFNRMLVHISAQSQELMDRNNSLHEQNNFIGAVLQGVTAGIVSVDQEGIIELINPSASRILDVDMEEVKGKRLVEVFDFFDDLFTKVRQIESLMITSNVVFNKKNHGITLAVRVTKDVEESKTKYIFTFDNISDLVLAQRKAAWSDVARRIAHEIKNPLTPIQLSAQRIERKYGDQITLEKDIFKNCIATIIHHVNQIGQMVDEFANFAKMPSAKLKEQNICAAITKVVSLQQLAHENVSYIWDAPKDQFLMMDENLILQALTNLLLNAYESFEGSDQESPCIKVSLIRNHDIIICIEDNGRGFPKENREKLIEPYITTRIKGTGLGLAIVKHIMEEHKGQLVLSDSDELGGAKIELIFNN